MCVVRVDGKCTLISIEIFFPTKIMTFCLEFEIFILEINRCITV